MNEDLLEASKAFLGILIILAVGVFLYFSFESVARVQGVTEGSEEGLVVKHIFKDGTHTVVGTVDLPTPCHTLRTEVAIAESFPEQVSIILTPINSGDICAQVITSQTFLASFKANVDASIYAQVNGRRAPIDIIEVSTQEELESF